MVSSVSHQWKITSYVLFESWNVFSCDSISHFAASLSNDSESSYWRFESCSRKWTNVSHVQLALRSPFFLDIWLLSNGWLCDRNTVQLLENKENVTWQWNKSASPVVIWRKFYSLFMSIHFSRRNNFYIHRNLWIIIIFCKQYESFFFKYRNETIFKAFIIITLGKHCFFFRYTKCKRY